MTDHALYDLYLEHCDALHNLFEKVAPAVCLGQMRPQQRAECDEFSRRFRALDQQITAELRTRKAPVHYPDVTLWLTSDRLNFISCEPGTHKPLHLKHVKLRREERCQENMFYRYDQPRPQ